MCILDDSKSAETAFDWQHPGEAPATTTAERAIAGAILRHALTVAGPGLVHQEWVGQDVATSAVPPIAEQILGFVVAAG